MTKFAFFCLLLSGIIISSSNLAIAKEMNKPSDVLSKFLSAQFYGDEDLLGYLCFSSKGKEANTLDYHLDDGMFYDFRYDSYTIVKDYKIESHEISNKAEKFIVIYNNLGKMESKAEHGSLINYFVEEKKIERVQYVMVKKKGKWCVIDPPKVRVSPAPIIKKYRDLKLRLYGDDKEMPSVETNSSKRMLKDLDTKLQQLQNVVDN